VRKGGEIFREESRLSIMREASAKHTDLLFFPWESFMLPGIRALT
jgi:hypothetical protein